MKSMTSSGVVAILLTMSFLWQGCGEQSDELDQFYKELQQNAPLQFDAGDVRWQEIVNSKSHPAVDAYYYGTAFYVRAGTTQKNESFKQVGSEIVDYVFSLLQQADDDTLYFVDHMASVGSAIFGAMEYVDQTGDRSKLDLIHRLVDTSNSFMQGFGYYYDWQSNSMVFGPTAISATSSMMNIKLLAFLDQAQQSEHLAYVENMMAIIETKARPGSYYLLRPSDENLYYYPNLEMGMAYAALYQATGNSEYFETTKRILDVISAFRDPIKGSYTDPEEYAEEGAQTNDFATLACQNYMIGLQLQLFEITKDQTYLQEAKNILNFIRIFLYDPKEKMILHHWIDGRRALPTDFIYLCGGCGLQTLYNLWFLKEHLKQ